jgi:hypothetical protein
MRHSANITCLSTGFMLVPFFVVDPEDGSEKFLGNVGSLARD